VFHRKINAELKSWAARPGRKPLVLRGARQVGKTTAVRMFAADFDVFISLNLEQAADLAIFSKNAPLAEVLEALYFLKGVPRGADRRTLIFIDEIQRSPEAVSMLRYFHEEAPHLYVIAAGSLLETMLDAHVSFPVGRVEFLLMHPVTFEEFLGAFGDEAALGALRMIPAPAYAHDKLSLLFRRYMLVGGMPEAVNAYCDSGDLNAVDRIYESLVIAYQEDVEKYGSTQRMVPIVRHIMNTAFAEAGGRIRYEGFGNSNYLARDIKEGFGMLQKAFLFQVVHPVTATSLPLSPDTKKSPRIHALDTGLVVFRTGMSKALFSAPDVSAVFSGRLLEHVVGQELYACNSSPLHSINFWARDKAQSNAEVDYVLPIDGRLIPVEVKSGASGRLRSLHAFINAASHALAVRLYGAPFSKEAAKTIAGKEFTLLNIPWYQAAMVAGYAGAE
jgi:uncharacterized protein